MSNEFVMVPRELAERIAKICMFTMYKEDYRAISEILAKPAEQHHGEPVAVFSIDSTGYRVKILDNARLPMDGTKLYTHGDSAEVERLRRACEQEFSSVERLNDEVKFLRAQLAERDALLREASYWLKRERWAGFDDAICKKIDATLSASAEPSAPVEIDNHASGCCCPPKGYSGIWAAAMCPVHQGIRRLERKPS